MWDFDSHLDYSQQSPLKGESLVFFSYDIFPFKCMSDPFLVMVMQSVTLVTPFCYGYGYAISHFEPSALIPLLGYIYFHIYGLWL